MPDLLVSSNQLLDALAHEELRLKQNGLYAQAAGMRTAIVILIRLTQAAKAAAPQAPSTAPTT